MNSNFSPVLGIVAEYNPLHTGHAYHLSRAIAAVRPAMTVVVMSGAVVQRGEFAVLDKYTRAHAALLCGADVVLEIPTRGVLQNADAFADAAAGLLARLGVDVLSFGSEGTPLQDLVNTASCLHAPTPAWKQAFAAAMQTGCGYAAAVQKATQAVQPGTAPGLLAGHPNDLLAVGYIRALWRAGRAAAGWKGPPALDQPVTTNPVALLPVPRTIPHDGGAGQHAASASALRACLAAGQGLETLAPWLPQTIQPLYQAAWQQGLWLTQPAGLDALLLHTLRNRPLDQLQALPGLGEGLAGRVQQAARAAGSWQQAIELAKTRRYPTARLRRGMLAAGLGLQAQDKASQAEQGFVPCPRYARVLAAQKACLPALGKLCSAAGIPLVVQPARQRKQLPPAVNQALTEDALAQDVAALGRPLTTARAAGEDTRRCILL